MNGAHCIQSPYQKSLHIWPCMISSGKFTGRHEKQSYKSYGLFHILTSQSKRTPRDNPPIILSPHSFVLLIPFVMHQQQRIFFVSM